jgi:hypothetical protein
MHLFCVGSGKSQFKNTSKSASPASPGGPLRDLGGEKQRRKPRGFDCTTCLGRRSPTYPGVPGEAFAPPAKANSTTPTSEEKSSMLPMLWVML